MTKIAMELKEFSPKKAINLPRWLETMVQCILFTFLAFVFSFFRLDLLIGKNSIFFFSNRFHWEMILFHLVLYYIYKIISTFTAVDKVVIDNSKQEVRIDYWLFYIIKKKKTIKFSEFSFLVKHDFYLTYKAIKIYQNNKYKIKLNAGNSWKKEQVEEIINAFLEITEDKERESSWYHIY
jgi:hypothetical protein